MIQITDRVTVIRDGKFIGTVDTKDATQLTLAQMMVDVPFHRAQGAPRI